MESINNITAPAGNVELELVNFLRKKGNADKKAADAQENPMIAYVEQAWAEAIEQSGDFEVQASLWKRLSNMPGVPQALKGFFNGENDLFNHNPEMLKLKQALQDMENKSNKDQNSEKIAAKVAHDALLSIAAVPLILLSCSLGAASAIAKMVYASKVKGDEAEIASDKSQISSQQNMIQQESLGLANKENSSTNKILNDKQIIAEALVGDLKTCQSFAKELAQAS